MDFRFDRKLTLGGAARKAELNERAIALLKSLEQSGRTPDLAEQGQPER